MFILVSDTKNGWWRRPLYLKFRAKLTQFEQNPRFSIDIHS